VGRRDVLVGAGSGAVRLGLVTAPGKRPMPAPDWARGARLTEQVRLGVAA
jgi:methionyl-tRNA formyltransferase